MIQRSSQERDADSIRLFGDATNCFSLPDLRSRATIQPGGLSSRTGSYLRISKTEPSEENPLGIQDSQTFLDPSPSAEETKPQLTGSPDCHRRLPQSCSKLTLHPSGAMWTL